MGAVSIADHASGVPHALRWNTVEKGGETRTGCAPARSICAVPRPNVGGGWRG